MFYSGNHYESILLEEINSYVRLFLYLSPSNFYHIGPIHCHEKQDEVWNDLRELAGSVRCQLVNLHLLINSHALFYDQQHV